MNQHENESPRNPAQQPNGNPNWAKKLLLYCQKHRPDLREHYGQAQKKGAAILRWIWWALNVDIVRNESAMAICTAMILVVTGVYSYFAYLQWDATRQAADAAESAADTASETLKAAHNNFMMEQRPYLVTDTPQFLIVPTASGITKANVTFKNIGRTPAIRVRRNAVFKKYNAGKVRTTRSVDIYVAFLQNEFQRMESKLDKALTEKYNDLARVDIAPNGTSFTTTGLEVPLTPDEIPKVAAGEMTLIYVGIARYADSLNGAYETQFCYFYAGNDPVTWHICDSNNTIK
jgi:hypothetical protein